MWLKDNKNGPRANLSGANLDMSCLPLSCGGLKLKIDKKIACQLIYHVCSMVCDDPDVIAYQNSGMALANLMHRTDVPRLELKTLPNK